MEFNFQKTKLEDREWVMQFLSLQKSRSCEQTFANLYLCLLYTSEVKVDEYKGIIKNKKIQKIPIVRGVFNFIDSLVLGMKTLMYSSSFFLEEDEEEEDKKASKKPEKTAEQQKKSDDLLMGLTVAFSIVMAVGIFMILPYFISNILRRFTDSALLISLGEGVIRILIFLAYIFLDVYKRQES